MTNGYVVIHLVDEKILSARRCTNHDQAVNRAVELATEDTAEDREEYPETTIRQEVEQDDSFWTNDRTIRIEIVPLD